MKLDIEDVLNEVEEKLTVLTDLFNFYQTIEMHSLIADFRKKTFAGIIFVIDDCINKLETLKKENI